ncbi:ESCRT-II subunit protein [Starmerella bacillaris]|uniref:ESCRT-II subunit protein n=1 Tax=Starmerella bacillaris TaxID=1247836 RepID=A0AAV5RHK8_STABA|nr:ESCRT-II subunit protein [Starmerella bacillaris]
MQQYVAVGAEISTEASTAIAQQLVQLEKLVLKLESKYGKQVLEDPSSRAALAEICLSLGINPLHLSLEKHSRTPEFYARLQVAVINISQGLSSQNSGCMSLKQLQHQVQTQLREKVTIKEVTKAITDLNVLGPGLRLETLSNGLEVVRTVTGELSSAQGEVYIACDALGYVSTEVLHDNLGWTMEHSQEVLDNMVSTGFLWIDDQVSPAHYWNPGIIENQI